MSKKENQKLRVKKIQLLKFEGKGLDELGKVEIDNKYKIGKLLYIGSCGFLFEVSNIS